jgi:phosphoglycolate phosphatase
VQPIHAVLFDLDGTLLDTLSDIAAAMNRALHDLGLPAAPIEDYRGRVGWGLTELARQTLPAGKRQDTALLETLTDRTRAFYADHPVESTVPYPGIYRLVASLFERGVPMAVVSNKPDFLVQPIVARTLTCAQVGVTGYNGSLPFAFVAGQREDFPAKPDPTLTLHVMEALGVEPVNTAFVGDSEVDMETARRAGCRAVGVSWGFRTADAVAAAGADVMCDTIEDLERELASARPQEGEEL